MAERLGDAALSAATLKACATAYRVRLCPNGRALRLFSPGLLLARVRMFAFVCLPVGSFAPVPARERALRICVYLGHE